MTKRFAIIKGDIVDNIVLSDDPLDVDGLWIDITSMSPEPLIGWGYVNGAFVAPPEKPYVPPSVITKAAFRFRFTDPEYVGILSAAKTDINVASWVETFNMLSTVDLKNQRTIDGVNNLVSAGLLTADRANQILTAPVQPGEMP
jgi:hypothetical protein